MNQTDEPHLFIASNQTIHTSDSEDEPMGKKVKIEG